MAEVSSELYIDSMNVAALVRETFEKAHECIASVNGAIASLHDAESALRSTTDYIDAHTPVEYVRTLEETTSAASASLSTLNGALDNAWRAHRDWSEKGHCLAPAAQRDALVSAIGGVSLASLELDSIFGALRDESSRYADDETVRFVYDVCRTMSDVGGATSLRGLHLACEMQARWIAELSEAANAQ